jgi:multicomponent Na+:H+ antiporter subunit D
MAIDLAIPPAAALLAGTLGLVFARGRARDAVMLLAPLVALVLVWNVPDGESLSATYLGRQLVLQRGDALSRWFGTIFALMSFAGGLFALSQRNRLEPIAAQLYAGAALGVVFAGDLVSVFIFWELMAIGSTLVIWSAGERARAAGMRYLLIHLFGGVLLMAGLVGHVVETGTTAFTAMRPDSFARWLILAGFLINAGAPPLSAWLPDAYPQSSFSGMVVLSAFTTKAAIYVLMRGFPGAEILIWVGLFMIFYGIVYAILENDMRRILAYSIVNQVGFMVTGIGIGTELALNGAASHAFAHIIYKALLLMSAGSVLYMTGKSKCTDLGGLFRTMPLTALCGIVGALSISAFPLTSGFVTKSMITDAAGHEHMALVWFLLTAGSAGVFLHAGIKFPWFVFFQKDSGLRPAEPPWNMRAAMIFFAVLCVLFGVAPGILYRHLPFSSEFIPYTGDHVVSQLQLLLFSGLAFFLMLGWLKRTLTITLDTDWFYRALGPALARPLQAAVANGWRGLSRSVESGAGSVIASLDAVYRNGALSRQQASGTMALVALAALAAYLLVQFIV